MKKVLSALLIMLMLIQTVSFAASDKFYTEDATKQLADKLRMLNIFTEFDEEAFFGDNADVKRSEAAVVISNMLGMKNFDDKKAAEIKFYDVPPYCEYINAVNYVTGLEIMSANAENKFLPDDSMEVAHVLKALVVALGYRWKAEAYGGYPTGYVRVATELKLTDVITKGIHENATRIDFLKMVEAALDVPICRIKSISSDVMDFEIDENTNVLSEYQNIYVDKGVVENNKLMNISSDSEIDEDVVYIGGRKIQLNGVYDVYEYFGYEVEYYYKHDVKNDTNFLLMANPTEENVITRISKIDFNGYANGKISYYNEGGKEKELKLSSAAEVIYNGGKATNISDVLNGYEGTMLAVDNNKDNLFDVVIVKNYDYDKIKSTRIDENKIYTTDKIINLDMYEKVSINLVETGEEITLEEVAEGSIIGYAIADNGKKLILDVLGTGTAVTISSVSGDEFSANNGAKYDASLLKEEHKALIRPGKTVSIVLIDGYYAVWADVASEAVSLGYLINIATDTEFGEEYIVGARILDVGGNVIAFNPANEKKMILNGKSVNVATLKTELANIKTENKLGGSGQVSQIISYKLNDDGALSHIYTVSDGEESILFLKYGYRRDGDAKVYDGGYKITARFGNEVFLSSITSSFWTYNYFITSKHPIFEVPEKFQEELSEEWYTVTNYSTDMYANAKITDDNGVEKDGVRFDSYVGNKRGVTPKALVRFIGVTEPGTEMIPTEAERRNTILKGKFILVDSAYQSLNDDGGAEYVISGLSKGDSVTYFVDSTKISAEEVDSLEAVTNSGEVKGFTTGDIAVARVNAQNKIVELYKLYDNETKTVCVYEGVDAEGNAFTIDCNQYVSILSAYNKSDDNYALEMFDSDLTQGIPSREYVLLLDLYAAARGAKNLPYYDSEQEKAYLGGTEDIIDYHQDPEKYTQIFIKHNNGWYNADETMVFYN